MKKSLLAIAAMTAFAGAAQAQSSVSVYGVMDAGYLSINNVTGSTAANNNRVSSVQSGGLSSPRLGFKGVEDLGGGMSAKFVLEAEVLTATGETNGISSTNTQFFNRASYMGLADKKMGEVRLGLFNTSGYSNIVKFDALGASNLGGLVNYSNSTAANSGSGDQSSASYGRVANGAGYYSPKIAGFSASFATGTKQSSSAVVVPSGTNAANQRVTDFGLNYDYKKLALAASYATLASSAGSMDTQGTTAAGSTMMGGYASYDFGIAKAFGAYVANTGKGTGGTTNRTYALGVRAPITSKITAAASFSQFKAGSTYTNNNGSMVALQGTYSLSKRTTLYALSAFSNNQSGAITQISSSSKFDGTTSNTAGLNQSGYMAGVRHTF